MANSKATWKVLPHGELLRLAENLWWVEGSLSGMSLKRNMTVVRLGDGRLVIHSAVALGPDGMSALEALGTPAFLLVPSRYHRLDAPAYKQRYPQLKVLAPAGARKQVEEVLALDGTYDDFPADDSVSLHKLDGVAEREGLMRVRSADGVTLVFNDVVFNMDKKTDFLGWLMTTLLGSAPGPRVSRLAKFALIPDHAAFRAELLRLAQTPELARVIVAHEKVASGPDARAVLERAATYL